MEITKFSDDAEIFYEMFCSGILITFDEIKEQQAISDENNNFVLRLENVDVAVIQESHMDEFKKALAKAEEYHVYSSTNSIIITTEDR